MTTGEKLGKVFAPGTTTPVEELCRRQYELICQQEAFIRHQNDTIALLTHPCRQSDIQVRTFHDGGKGRLVVYEVDGQRYSEKVIDAVVTEAIKLSSENAKSGTTQAGL